MRSTLALLLLTLATPALSVDGVLEINQTCAAETGCFAGDAPEPPVTITQAGSYILTSNLRVLDPNLIAIEIAANDVTLNLNGHTISGPASSGTGRGIYALNHYNITVRNGRVWGFAWGGVVLRSEIGDPSQYGAGHRIEAMHVANNGSGGIEIWGGLVTDSSANGNLGEGIRSWYSTVSRSTANKNTSVGIEANHSAVSHCTAVANDYGFLVRDSQLSHCTANHNDYGISATHSTVSHCRANWNRTTGIKLWPEFAESDSYLHHSAASDNTGTQIDCPGNGSINVCVDNAEF
jgi:hypothetical protein